MSHVVLIGFMGAGKSTVGPLLAEELGRPFLELDDTIAADAGRSVAAIFEEEGEPGFRRRETRCLQATLEGHERVIAVGGGAPLPPGNWEAIRRGNLVVALTAEPAELLRRLDGAGDRPLLFRGAAEAVERLLPLRTDRYLQADLVMRTDAMQPDAIARTIARDLPEGPIDRLLVNVPGAPHEIAIGRRLAGLVPPALRRAQVEGSVVVATDAQAAVHAPALEQALGAAGLMAHRYVLPAGESAKTLAAVTAFYDFLSTVPIDRAGALVALGGGSVGDVTGFVAATYLRGLRYLQMPTTLLAMVDSSIGGKTGVNLGAGKNLVGAVHQPCAILADTAVLATLPEAEYRAAFAEVIKSAMVDDAAFVTWLDRNRERLLAREPAAVHEAVVRTASIKARIVAQDPLEGGLRAVLNFGHTAGHALERALGYGTLPHGESVAWGMRVAAALSRRTDRCGLDVVLALDRILRDYGLLSRPPKVSHGDVLRAMRHDKKARRGEPRWVLIRHLGEVEYGCRVDPEDVEAALVEGLLP